MLKTPVCPPAIKGIPVPTLFVHKGIMCILIIIKKKTRVIAPNKLIKTYCGWPIKICWQITKAKNNTVNDKTKIDLSFLENSWRNIIL